MDKQLKKLLKKGQVWFDIPEENKERFLRYAKFNGCKWINCEEIHPETDICSCHMAITNNFRIGYVSPMCWCAKTKNKPHIEKFKVINHIIHL